MAKEELSRVSCSLYSAMNIIIGPEVIIEIRRTTTNLRDNIFRLKCELQGAEYEPCYSGSRAEGLRFESSDEDWMYIYRDIKVIPSDSYMKIYDSNSTLLLMENEMTKPGFTLLRLVDGTTKWQVSRSTEHILNGSYLSCKHWRESHTGILSDKESTHGPCASATIFDSINTTWHFV